MIGDETIPTRSSPSTRPRRGRLGAAAGRPRAAPTPTLDGAARLARRAGRRRSLAAARRRRATATPAFPLLRQLAALERATRRPATAGDADLLAATALDGAHRARGGRDDGAGSDRRARAPDARGARRVGVPARRLVHGDRRLAPGEQARRGRAGIQVGAYGWLDGRPAARARAASQGYVLAPSLAARDDRRHPAQRLGGVRRRRRERRPRRRPLLGPHPPRALARRRRAPRPGPRRGCSAPASSAACTTRPADGRSRTSPARTRRGRRAGAAQRDRRRAAARPRRARTPTTPDGQREQAAARRQLDALLDGAPATTATALADALDALADDLDAVADASVAQSVFSLAEGNVPEATATLTAAATGEATLPAPALRRHAAGGAHDHAPAAAAASTRRRRAPGRPRRRAGARSPRRRSRRGWRALLGDPRRYALRVRFEDPADGRAARRPGRAHARRRRAFRARPRRSSRRPASRPVSAGSARCSPPGPRACARRRRPRGGRRDRDHRRGRSVARRPRGRLRARCARCSPRRATSTGATSRRPGATDAASGPRHGRARGARRRRPRRRSRPAATPARRARSRTAGDAATCAARCSPSPASSCRAACRRAPTRCARRPGRGAARRDRPPAAELDARVADEEPRVAGARRARPLPRAARTRCALLIGHALPLAPRFTPPTAPRSTRSFGAAAAGLARRRRPSGSRPPAASIPGARRLRVAVDLAEALRDDARRSASRSASSPTTPTRPGWPSSVRTPTSAPACACSRPARARLRRRARPPGWCSAPGPRPSRAARQTAGLARALRLAVGASAAGDPALHGRGANRASASSWCATCSRRRSTSRRSGWSGPQTLGALGQFLPATYLPARSRPGGAT